MDTRRGENILIANLNTYKRKFYLNQLLRGTIFLTGSLLSAYLLVNTLEFAVGFNSSFRAFLFFSFVAFTLFVLYRWVFEPLFKLLSLRKRISDEEAARQIGSHFPEISDRLINTLQLQQLSHKNSDLIAASILQKTKKISVIPFSDAITIGDNKKYLKYLVIPTLIIILIVILAPHFLKDSTIKIINYNKEFVPQAPFSFVLENSELKAFRNEDFTVSVKFEGTALPQIAYLLNGDRRIKMQQENGSFFYTFQKMQRNTGFRFEAAGFTSVRHEIEVVNRPNLKNFNIHLSYPKYLRIEDKTLNNIGNLEVPEGTHIEWQFNTIEAESMDIQFQNSKEIFKPEMSDNQIFMFSKEMKASDDYDIRLQNQFSANKERISYHIEVIPDQYPTINVEQFQDTTLYSFLVLGGNISDDHGISQLSLFYSIIKDNDKNNGKENTRSFNLPINKNRISQSYYQQIQLDSIDLKDGDRIEYYLKVWDNDGVNGRKSTKTASYIFSVPSKKELKESLTESSKNAEKQIDQALQKAQELKESLKEEEEKLKTQKDLKWQDKKRLEEILKKRKELDEALEKLKEINKINDQKRERFSENSEKIKEKAQQLQKLMDELMDEETKKLYDELQKLLEDKADQNNVQDILEKLNNKETNLEKELERSLELFKKLKFDHMLEETIKEVNEVTEEQKDLSEKSLDKSTDKEQLSENQEDLNKKFEEVKKSIDELNEINQDRKNPDAMQDVSEEKKEIDQLQKQSQEELQKNKRKKASESQKKAGEKMQKMGEKLQQMQSGAEMSMMMENLDNLRDIVDNLVKLSFEQESLMENLRKVKQSDPRFIQLSQQQLKLKDDSKIIEDSLTSLSQRVFQIASFVTRELDEMKGNMDKTVDALKDRKKSLAVSKQQFTMTSINNLALLLDDVLQQMQQQMADAQGKPQKGNKSKNMPGLSDLQKQLNQQIEQLKKSGKSGRQLSEELAKLAAEQEKLRRSLQELNDSYGQKDKDGKNGKNGIKDLLKKMEETETDLVNKRLTSEMLKRQKEITTRLLEAENALREREQDEKREAERAKDYERKLPKAFEEYIKLKEKEIELLKTVPLKLNPYYKKEVNEYFKRIEK